MQSTKRGVQDLGSGFNSPSLATELASKSNHLHMASITQRYHASNYTAIK